MSAPITGQTDERGHGRGPTFRVNTEGVEHLWSEPTILPAQIRQLAGWSDEQPIVAVDLQTNTETTLPENEPITLKPGVGFGRKIRFKRGQR